MLGCQAPSQTHPWSPALRAQSLPGVCWTQGSPPTLWSSVGPGGDCKRGRGGCSGVSAVAPSESGLLAGR